MAKQEMKALALNMDRATFRGYAEKAMGLLRSATSFIPSQRVSEAVELIAHLFEDDDHFNQLCDVLGIPPS